MANNNDKPVIDPTHKDYGKEKDKPTNNEVTARHEQLQKVLPDTGALSQCPDFRSGKQVNFSGLQASVDTPSGSLLGPENRARVIELELRRMGANSMANNSMENKSMGVFNRAPPNGRDFARISTSNGCTSLVASYHPNSEQAVAVEALELSIVKMAGKDDLIRKTVTIESHGAIRNHRRTLRGDPLGPNNERRLLHKHKASTKEITWAPLIDQCSNCMQFGHVVIDCWGPIDKYGYINKCPCNGLGHHSNECPRVRQYSNLLKFKVFYIHRVGLPPFKHRHMDSSDCSRSRHYGAAQPHQVLDQGRKSRQYLLVMDVQSCDNRVFHEDLGLLQAMEVS